MIPDMVTMRSRRWWPSLVLIAGIMLQGCGARAPGTAGNSGSVTGDTAAEVPAGAIPIGDALYQVPIDADEDGCPRYRLYSPTRLVAQVIYYRDRAGGFTTDRRQAACAPAAD